VCLSETSLPNLQRILDFLSLRNLASNELFFMIHIILKNWREYIMLISLNWLKQYVDIKESVEDYDRTRS